MALKTVRSRGQPLYAARTITVRGGGRALYAALAIVASGCGGGDAQPPKAKHEDPAAHVMRIARVWRESVEDEGLPDGRPEITFVRIETVLRLELGQAGAAREAIERTELFRTADGFEYHCVAMGAVPASARYEAIDGEIHVALASEAARLPRSCREPAFKKKWEDIPAKTTTFALRSDRLVAIDPPLARNVLLPIE